MNTVNGLTNTNEINTFEEFKNKLLNVDKFVDSFHEWKPLNLDDSALNEIYTFMLEFEKTRPDYNIIDDFEYECLNENHFIEYVEKFKNKFNIDDDYYLTLYECIWMY